MMLQVVAWDGVSKQFERQLPATTNTATTTTTTTNTTTTSICSFIIKRGKEHNLTKAKTFGNDSGSDSDSDSGSGYVYG